VKTLPLIVIACLFASLPLHAGAGSAEPPHETRARLGDATQELDKREVSGVFTFRSHRITSNKNGEDRQEWDEVFEVKQRGASESERTLVKSTRDGEDVTEERREEIRKQEADGQQRRGPELKLPTAEHDLFVFRALEPDGDLCVSGYEPKPEARDTEGVTEGQLAWNCESGEPAWLEARFVDNPMLVEQLQIRWRFGRVGEMIITEHNTFQVVAGPPFFKRRIESSFDLVDVQTDGEVDVAGGESEEAARSE
jgi:hypothetical protein